MNQLAFKDRDLAKDTASRLSFLKTFEDFVIQCAKHWTGNKEIEGFHFWHVTNHLCLRDWFKKRGRLHILFLIPFHTWKKWRDSDVNAQHISLAQKGQRPFMCNMYITCLSPPIFI